jgi:hypothetical protein
MERMYQAGERVPPGMYRQVKGNRREVYLCEEDYLPASSMVVSRSTNACNSGAPALFRTVQSLSRLR